MGRTAPATPTTARTLKTLLPTTLPIPTGLALEAVAIPVELRQAGPDRQHGEADHLGRHAEPCRQGDAPLHHEPGPDGDPEAAPNDEEPWVPRLGRIVQLERSLTLLPRLAQHQNLVEHERRQQDAGIDTVELPIEQNEQEQGEGSRAATRARAC